MLGRHRIAIHAHDSALQGAKLFGAKAWLKHPPNMTLRISGLELLDAKLDVFRQDQPTRPVVLNASIPLWTIPEAKYTSTLALHFDDIASRRVPLTAVAHDAQPIQPRTWPPMVYTLAAANAVDAKLGGRMIKLHCEW